jgi:hypothetical protein
MFLLCCQADHVPELSNYAVLDKSAVIHPRKY